MNPTAGIQGFMSWVVLLILVIVLAGYGLYRLITGRLRREARGHGLPILTIITLGALAAFVITVILPHLRLP
jgi:uncharacterized membrane protein